MNKKRLTDKKESDNLEQQKEDEMPKTRKYRPWMTTLTPEQHEWIKEMSRTAGLQGSEIIRSLIDKARQDSENTFQADIREQHIKKRLEAINDRMSEFEEERQELNKQLSQIKPSPKMKQALQKE